MDIGIDPTATGASGDTVLGLSGQVKKHLDTALWTSVAIGTGEPGWLSATALGNCGAAWQRHLGTLADEMGQLGENVRATADQYDWADGEIAKRLSTGLNNLGRA
ncbi:type VII secretion target [Embleya sp. NPDC005575]|uniref:type VII secretion target n=1 Tax=Embleya sp. NPDC005575 TaxID=3156892 RepID=UPI00339DFBAB